eukprot:9209267-Alexandrium_andersonii.AAC.1
MVMMMTTAERQHRNCTSGFLLHHFEPVQATQFQWLTTAFKGSLAEGPARAFIYRGRGSTQPQGAFPRRGPGYGLRTPIARLGSPMIQGTSHGRRG